MNQQDFSIEKQGKNKVFWVAIVGLAVFSIFIYIINVKTPLMGEDYALTTRNYFMNDFDSFSEHFLRVFNMIVEHMREFSVRLGDQLAIIMLSFDKSIYNLISVFVIIWFFVLMFFYGLNRLPKLTRAADVIVLFFCVTVTFCVCEFIGDIFFWADGSLNYLWTVSLLLTTAMPIRSYIGGKKTNIKPVWLVFYSLICFIAAFGNENTTPVIIALMFFTILFNKLVKKRATPMWFYISFFSYTIGWLILACAPSTKFRGKFYRQMFGMPENISVQEIVGNALRVSFITFEVTWKYALIAVAIAALFIILWKKKKIATEQGYKSLMFENLTFLVLSLISLAALCFAPYTEPRSTMFVHFFLVALCAAMLMAILNAFEKSKRYTGGVVCASSFMTILMILVCSQIYTMYADYSAFDKERTIQIVTQVQSGKKDLQVEHKYIRNRLMNNREEYVLGVDLIGMSSYSMFFSANSIKTILAKPLTKEELNIEGFSQAQAEGHLDWITDGTQSEAGWESPYADRINMGGWVINSIAQKSADEVYIKIDDQYFQCDTMERTDVAKAFNNKAYNNAGFLCKIDGVQVGGAGSHTFALVAIDRENQYIFEKSLGSLEFYLNKETDKGPAKYEFK